MTELTKTNVPRWYKQFWPWYLIFLPASAVVAGIATVIIAFSHRDPLVVDNYYKEGLAINRVITQQQRAAGLGLLAQAEYHPETGRLSIVLDTPAAENIKGLTLSFVHATREDFDKTIILYKDTPGVFSTTIKDIKAGRWNVFLEPVDKQWRLDAQVVFPIDKWVFKPEV